MLQWGGMASPGSRGTPASPFAPFFLSLQPEGDGRGRTVGPAELSSFSGWRSAVRSCKREVLGVLSGPSVAVPACSRSIDTKALRSPCSESVWQRGVTDGH